MAELVSLGGVESILAAAFFLALGRTLLLVERDVCSLRLVGCLVCAVPVGVVGSSVFCF